MGDDLIGGDGNYDSFNDLLRFWDKKQTELKDFKGVALKNEKNKTIGIRFTLAGKRIALGCNEPFTETGMVRAVEKAKKVYEALQRFDSTSEFEIWYKAKILKENELSDDRLTYRQIFKRIEQGYWTGNDRNTNQPRKLADGTSLKNHQSSYEQVYVLLFKRFADWDKFPEWKDLSSVLFSWEQGIKSFKDAHGTIGSPAIMR